MIAEGNADEMRAGELNMGRSGTGNRRAHEAIDANDRRTIGN
jgi:hypothetical protein